MTLTLDQVSDQPVRSSSPLSPAERTPILLDPLLLKFLRLGIHCKVQLMSEELELDAYDLLVPKDWKVIDLIVLDDSRETIKQIVASTPEYQGFRVTDHWNVLDENPF